MIEVAQESLQIAGLIQLRLVLLHLLREILPHAVNFGDVRANRLRFLHRIVFHDVSRRIHMLTKIVAYSDVVDDSSQNFQPLNFQLASRFDSDGTKTAVNN